MYRKMGRSLLFLLLCSLPAFAQKGVALRGGLPHFFEKAKRGDTLRVVYIGGSITQAPGYRVKSAAWLKNRFPLASFEFFNAGVGGTGSDLGAFRTPEDVLSRRPDLVFIEFAVNDQATDTARIIRAMDGIIGQILSADPKTSICLLYTASERLLANYQMGSVPASVAAMERVASYYHLPSVNFAPALLSALAEGKMVYLGKPADTATVKNIFTLDGTHPLDAGHELYAGVLQNALALLQKAKPRPEKVRRPLYTSFSKTCRYEPALFASDNWKKVQASDPQGKFLRELPGLVLSEDPTDSLVIDFSGTMLGVEDVIGPGSNGLSVSIDGGKAFKVTRFDKYCSSYRRHYVLFNELPAGNHHVVIRPDFSPIDKLGILKPENREGFGRGGYNQNRTYIGKILIGGELIAK